MIQASPPAFDRESLHTWLLRLPRLSHAGGLHRQVVEVAAASSLRSAAMREIPGTPVRSSAGTPGSFAMSTPPVTSARVNASGGTASPGVSVGSSPSVSGEVEAKDSPSPELGGRAAHELRWLRETPVVWQGRTRG